MAYVVKKGLVILIPPVNYGVVHTFLDKFAKALIRPLTLGEKLIIEKILQPFGEKLFDGFSLEKDKS